MKAVAAAEVFAVSSVLREYFSVLMSQLAWKITLKFLTKNK